MDNITVLFPGSFKPMHSGHIDLIKRYCIDPSVKELRILIGPGSRGDINQTIALRIAQNLLSQIKHIKIIAVEDPTPMTTVYKFMESCDPGTYVLAASSKEIENTQRISRFVQSLNSGKYPTANGVKVIEMPVNIDPLLYTKRSDDNNGKPISASILRQDISEDNFENFKTNYPDYPDETIISIWSALKNG